MLRIWRELSEFERLAFHLRHWVGHQQRMFETIFLLSGEANTESQKSFQEHILKVYILVQNEENLARFSFHQSPRPDWLNIAILESLKANR